MHIHILGASGSGVTTLGNALAQQLDYPYFDSDIYFWLPSDPPFVHMRPPAERNPLLISHLAEHDNWILGGSIFSWSEDVFLDYDLVVFLYLPPEIRLPRLRDREYERYGDAIFTDAETKQKYEMLMARAVDYDEAKGLAKRTLPAHEEWLSRLSAPILELRGDLTVQQRVDAVLKSIEDLRNIC
ncbi:MAG TPA: AAA family ATPase [Mucilaginibacter sp.]|nr:AAA family ATPase [Mucilaginibacter sp.]